MGDRGERGPGLDGGADRRPSAASNVLNAVAVRGSTDAWAVGHFTAPDQDDDGLNMLTERWNGSSWRQIAAPAVLRQDESLLAVRASSATDAWAVGFTKSVGAAGRFPLAVHWNGSGWSVVPVPTPAGAVSSQLSGISALSANDIWAVGSFTTVSGTTVQGRTLAANNVWAVGYTITTDGSNQPDKTLVEHWNGTTWSVVASPNVGGNDNLLNGVSAATGDVWTVGSSEVFDHTLALRETG